MELSNATLKEENRLLREERDLLREENRQLRELFIEKKWEPPIELGLTRKEAVMLSVLIKHKGTVSKERFMDALYQLSNSREVPEQKIIDVFICNMRKKLKIYGVSIETVWGLGYTIAEDSRTILLNWGKVAEEMAG